MAVTYSKLFWFRLLGAGLAIIPSMAYIVVLVATTSDSYEIVPYFQYLLAANGAIIVGYFLMRKGVREEEKTRIKVLIREVLEEERPKPSCDQINKYSPGEGPQRRSSPFDDLVGG